MNKNRSHCREKHRCYDKRSFKEQVAQKLKELAVKCFENHIIADAQILLQLTQRLENIRKSQII
jgi:hypothetical protein